MTGFYISSIKTDMGLLKKYHSDYKTKENHFNEKNILQNIIPNNQYDIYYWTSEKFINDKLCAEDAEHIIILEGVILNFKELQQKYHVNTMWDLCKNLIIQKGDLFHTELIGNFAGAYLNKTTDTWTIFVNKYGSQALFYYYDGSNFIVAPLPIMIRDTLKQAEIPIYFNRDAAYLMLTYGFMGTNDTFIQEIKKLEAGCFLKISAGKAKVVRYHRFTNYKYDLMNASEEEIIEGIDNRFRAAIKLEYDKDLEYGYKHHFRALTGGTDSRACAFVAHNLGYKNVTNFTMGQPDYADEKISREISLYLHNNFIFQATNILGGDHDFLQSIDEAVYAGQGQSYYLDQIDMQKKIINIDPMCYGLLHGGAFSEAFLTTGYLKHVKMEPPTKPMHIYCDLVMDKCPKEHLKQYATQDIYSIYSIFFNKHTPTGRNLIAYDACTTFPGLYPDLVDYCLSIPIHLRKNYYIYHKWLFTKYPDAKQFKLEKWNAKIDDNKIKKCWGKLTRYGSPIQYFRCSKDKFPTIVRKISKLDKKIKPSPIALFPFDYWYENDIESRNYMDRYFSENLNHPVISKELRNDLQMVYEKGNARPKAMALTVLAAAKLFFGD